jgi:hypothetical protein
MNYVICISLPLLITLLAACTPAESTSGPAPISLPNPQPTAVSAGQPVDEAGKLQQGLPVDAPIIAYNEVKEGTLREAGVVDEWAFSAQAGDRVNVVLNSQFDSYLELYGPDGVLLASNDDRGNSLTSAIFDAQLKQTGPHIIAVRGYAGGTGNYALGLTGGHPTLGGGVLADGDSRTVVLSEQGVKWQYQGRQGSYLTVSITGDSGVDSFLSLYGPDGLFLTSDDDSGGSLNPEIADFALPADGSYTIGAHTIASTGLITLTVSGSSQPAGGGVLTIGQPQLAVLKPGRTHQWTFTGEAGQLLNISMISPEFDTFLELHNAAGEVLAENYDGPDGTSALISTFALPAAGEYTVMARSLSNDQGGNYELTVKPVKIAPGGGELTPDKTAQAVLAPGQTDTWTFTGEAGTFVTVKVQSTQLDSYLELYNARGELLIEDDDSGGGVNAGLLNYPLPESGDYQVHIKSAQSGDTQGGVYELTMQLAAAMTTAGQLESGQVITRELTAGQQDTWLFDAVEDDFVTIRMNSETLDTHLSLYDGDGELLYINDDFAGKQAAITNFIVPKDGQYRVVARSYSPEEAGVYVLTFDMTEDELPISPAPTENK